MRAEIDDFIAEAGQTAAGIRAAIAWAGEHGVREVHFRAGIYDLRDFVTIETDSAAHDDGCGDVHEKQCHIAAKGLRGLRVSGEKGPDGLPATLICGCHDNPIQSRLPALFWMTDCTDLEFADLAFTRAPETSWTGIVSAVRDGRVYVRMSDNVQLPAQTGAYCMNRFDPETGQLVGESLTNGFGYENRFIKTGEHELCIEDTRLAAVLTAGEGLSWHQSGLTDFLLFFGNCRRLSFSNIRICNTNAFALLTENCTDICARRLDIRPAPGSFFTGPRDGWKIYRCGGQIELDECHFEGLRMDAQNIHSNFFRLESVKGNTLVFSCKYAPIPLRGGSQLRIHGQEGEFYIPVVRWRFLAGKMEETRQSEDRSAGQAVVGSRNHISRYLVETAGMSGTPEAGQLKPGMLAEPLCWEPERYVCRNSVFRNIAGAGHLVRCRNVLLEHNRYENLMNAGILIGAELDTHCESGHGRKIVIRGNSFFNIGFKPRYGSYGCAAIAVKSQGFCAPVNGDICIEGNLFENCRTAVELNDARQVRIKDNQYRQVLRRLSVDTQSVEMESVTVEED